jgi:dephospho-CoA kinase
MKKVGITGGIGAGKSIVCRVFQKLNVPVYFADDRARWLMNYDKKLVGEIKGTFGQKAYLNNSELNRRYLADHVFSNVSELTKLNALVHPAVARDFEFWCQGQQGQPYVLKEAALLVESGSYKNLAALIVVTAPKQLRLHRVLMRDEERSEQQVLDIMEKQASENKKKKLADYLLNNDEKSLLIPQILKIHQSLKD